MILRPQLEPTDHQSVLDYYLAHYDEVHIVSCNKCGTDLAIEIRGEVSGYKQNEYGFTVLPFGENLLSSRVRSDGTMGYQCGAQVPNPKYAQSVIDTKAQIAKDKKKYDAEYEALNAGRKKSEQFLYQPPTFVRASEPETIRCMNDTRGTEIEEALSPTGTFLPHEVAAIHQKQIEIGWKPKLKRTGNKEVHETFTRERIK